eukprot:g21675.t1
MGWACSSALRLGAGCSLLITAMSQGCPALAEAGCFDKEFTCERCCDTRTTGAATMLPAMDHLSTPATCPPNAQKHCFDAYFPCERCCDTRRGAQGDLACWPDTAPMGLRTLSYNFCCGLMPFTSGERISCTEERADLNQYWFSPLTVAAFVAEITEGATPPARSAAAALVSSPSVYFSLPEESRANCKVLDYDRQWASDPGFVFYDFNAPEELPQELSRFAPMRRFGDAELRGAFDFILIDPPFITREVWEKYAITARYLACDGARFLCTTIAENASMMSELLGLHPVKFRPGIPNLVYQWLGEMRGESAWELNPEIDEEDWQAAKPVAVALSEPERPLGTGRPAIGLVKLLHLAGRTPPSSGPRGGRGAPGPQEVASFVETPDMRLLAELRRQLFHTKRALEAIQAPLQMALRRSSNGSAGSGGGQAAGSAAAKVKEVHLAAKEALGSLDAWLSEHQAEVANAMDNTSGTSPSAAREHWHLPELESLLETFELSPDWSARCRASAAKLFQRSNQALRRPRLVAVFVPPEPLLAISRRWKRQARPTHATAAEKPTPPYADAIFAYEAVPNERMQELDPGLDQVEVASEGPPPTTPHDDEEDRGVFRAEHSLEPFCDFLRVFVGHFAWQDLSLTYLDLLEIPPSRLWQAQRKSKKDIDLDDRVKDALVEAWNDGQSRRFKDDYRQWLASGSMNSSFLRDGHVYFHHTLKIGEGAAAEVFLGIVPSDGREVAVKVFREQEFGEKHFNVERSSMKEHSAMPGIVQYISSFQQEMVDNMGRPMFKKVVVLELMEGSLADAMARWREKEWVGKAAHLQVIRYVGASMLYTLSRLNYGAIKDLVHRDVKPDNIMIDHLGAIRLGDFGISKILEKTRDAATLSSGGPEAFASPEALQEGSSVSKAHRTSDLYSLGMVLFCMMSAQPGGKGLPRDFQSQMSFLKNQVPEQWPSYHSFAFQHLMKALLEREPSKRAFNKGLPKGMTPHRVVLTHPFFWSARNGLRFLVTLGNYPLSSEQNSALLGADLTSFRTLKQALKESIGGDSWFVKVADLEQVDPHATDDRLKKSPFGLLKFIRNKCIHLNDSSMNPEIRRKLQQRPVFQERFPELVVRCWEALLLDSIDNILMFMQHAQLREFFERPIELESFRGEPNDWM